EATRSPAMSARFGPPGTVKPWYGPIDIFCGRGFHQLFIRPAGRGLGSRRGGRSAVAWGSGRRRMGRRERPGDPAAGPLQAFAHQLRELRRAAGSPSYRELGRRAHFSDTSLSVAASGVSLPSLEVTLGYVRACGGDIAEWERRWRQVARQHG